jgi:hypothetical protein
VRAGRKSNDERTKKSETSFNHRGALLPKIELHGAATLASTRISPNLRVGSQETEWGNENAGEQKILAFEGRDQGLNQFQPRKKLLGANHNTPLLPTQIRPEKDLHRLDTKRNPPHEEQRAARERRVPSSKVKKEPSDLLYVRDIRPVG